MAPGRDLNLQRARPKDRKRGSAGDTLKAETCRAVVRGFARVPNRRRAERQPRAGSAVRLYKLLSAASGRRYRSSDSRSTLEGAEDTSTAAVAILVKKESGCSELFFFPRPQRDSSTGAGSWTREGGEHVLTQFDSPSSEYLDRGPSSRARPCCRRTGWPPGARVARQSLSTWGGRESIPSEQLAWCCAIGPKGRWPFPKDGPRPLVPAIGRDRARVVRA